MLSVAICVSCDNYLNSKPGLVTVMSNIYKHWTFREELLRVRVAILVSLSEFVKI